MPDTVEDQQPQLKYQRLEADVTDICGSDTATFLCVTTKVLALGTLSGSVHILDVSGNEVSLCTPLQVSPEGVLSQYISHGICRSSVCVAITAAASLTYVSTMKQSM